MTTSSMMMLMTTATTPVLGNGFAVIPISGDKKGEETRYLVQSVPGELSTDHTAVLSAAEEAQGSVSVQLLVDSRSWDRERAQRALDHLVKEGLAWVDEQSKNTLYWFPALFRPGALSPWLPASFSLSMNSG